MDSSNSSGRSVWAVFGICTVALSVVSLILIYATGGWSWWLPLPSNVSAHGGEIDWLFYVCVWITGITFVLVQAAMVAFLIHYRHRPGRKAVYSHGDKKLELIWTVAPTVILLVVVGYSIKVWADIRNNPPEQPDVVIDVLAQQFQWNFRYPSPTAYNDKDEFGATSIDLMTRTNFFGLDDAGDEKARDDVVTLNEMHIPKDKDVIVYLRSKDVLHSFYLPHMRVKMDAVPGNEGVLYFKATDIAKEGERFEVVCAELCGFQHYTMRATFIVDETVEAFEEWLRANARSGS